MLLAFGLGVNTAVFSVLDALFLRPLLFSAPDRLVLIEESTNGKTSNSNPVRLHDWRTRVSAFATVASTFGESLQLREIDGNRGVLSLRVIGDWIGMLGVPMIEGRNFDGKELEGGKVAILAARARDIARVGESIRLGAESYTVIGIVANEIAPGEDVQVVLPIDAAILKGNRKAGYLQAVARLKPAISLEAADAELHSVAAQLAKEFPDTDRERVARLVPAQQAWAAEAREPAMYIQAAAALLLLITLVNLAGLLAARALERNREDSIRLFLGAGRWHLIRLHLVESGLLVAFGCMAAAMVAPWALALLQLNYGDSFAPIKTAVIDTRVLAYLGATGILATLIFTGIMALQTSNEHDPRGHAQFRLRNILIVSEAALGLVLLAVSFQLVQDFSRLRFSPLGIQEQGLLSARAYLSWGTDFSEIRSTIDRGIEQLSALPGVTGVAVVDRLPLEGGSQDSPLFIQGQPEKTRDSIGIRMASGNYFSLMGIPLLAGQMPTDDTAILVNEAFSRRYLNNQPIGRSVSNDGKKWLRVSGVVGNVRFSSKDSRPRPEIFLSERTQFWPLLTFVIRTSQPASSLTQPIRKLFSTLNPEIDFRGVSALESRIDELVQQPRRQRDVVAAFGLVSLILVVAGVYGIMASEMLRRRREIGIRVAVGASRANIIGLGVMRAAWLTLAACLLGGAILIFLLSEWVEPQSVLAAIAAVTVGMLLAGFLPAWRGSREQPLLALRQN